MDISIIIVTKDRPRDLEGCLGSIRRQSLLPKEVVIVDVSRGSHTEDICRSWQPKDPIRLKYLRLTPNPGIARQRNAGIESSTGQIVGFIDDDAVMDKRCLENIKAHFLKDDDLGGVGAMNEENTEIPWLKRLFWRTFMLSRFDGKGRIQRSGYPAFCNDPGAREVECISTVAAFFKKNIFGQFHFDEHLPTAECMEDVDLSFRVSKRYKLIQSTQARIYHKNAREARLPISVRTYMIIYYHDYFFKKNMRKSFLNKAALLWSRVGEILRAGYWAAKELRLEPLQGAFKAYRHIWRDSRGE